MIHIFIDDSGTLHDPRESIVTIAALATHHLPPLQWIIRRARRHVKYKPPKHVPAEFKFYNTTAQARGLVLDALAKEDVEIYALNVHKGK